MIRFWFVCCSFTTCADHWLDLGCFCSHRRWKSVKQSEERHLSPCFLKIIGWDPNNDDCFTCRALRFWGHVWRRNWGSVENSSGAS
nr:hypothetical protein X990_5433 [Burkholderia pseudomallei MSHR4868]